MNAEAIVIERASSDNPPLPMPPEIAKAILEVISQIKTLGVDEKHSFEKYNYVSVDKFYAAIAPLMARSGLFSMLFEREVIVSKRLVTTDRGDVKEQSVLTFRFDIVLYHLSGSSYGPVPRQTSVRLGGAQSYAAAASYVEKYFLRQLFKVPTGEKDAEELVIIEASNGNGAKPIAPSPVRPSSASRYFDEARQQIDAATDSRALKEWWNADRQKNDRKVLLEELGHVDLLRICKAKIAKLEAEEKDQPIVEHPRLKATRTGLSQRNNDDPTDREIDASQRRVGAILGEDHAPN